MKLHPILQDKKLILFDFDGTLVDSMDMWVSIDEKIFACIGSGNDKLKMYRLRSKRNALLKGTKGISTDLSRGRMGGA